MKAILLFCFLFITTTLAVKKSYEGYTVYKIKPNSNDQVAVLNNIGNNGIGEFWEEQISVDKEVKIMVPKENQETFLALMKSARIETTVVILDLQKLMDDQLKSSLPTNRNTENFHNMTWNRYHTLKEIYTWLDLLASEYPDKVKTVVWGQTNEGRDIKGIVVDTDINSPDYHSKSTGVIEGALHAREWITPATVTWIIKEFLTSTDPVIATMVNAFRWHILPVANPDGYSYTFTNDRMWRKNRNTAYAKNCTDDGIDDDRSNGVDLNRNFAYQWMEIGASNDSCSNLFAGPSANSEPETRAIVNYLAALNSESLVYYLAFHSYTQLVVVPHSHFTSVGEMMQNSNTNYADMYEIGIRAAEALQRRSGTTYRVGISADVMYPMSGTSFDWVKQEFHVPVCYLIELRDLGDFGFLLPPEQIIPNNLEVMDFIKEMDISTRNLRLYSYHDDAPSLLRSPVVIISSFIVALYLNYL